MKVLAGDLFELAVQYHQAGRFSEAKDAYVRLIESSAEHSAGLANLGMLFLQTSKPNAKEFNEGMQFLAQSLAKNSNQPFAHNNLANAFAAIGSFEDSDKHYLEAIRCQPKYLDAYINRALMLKRFRGIESAKAWLVGFKDDFVNEVAFWVCVGAMELDGGAYEEALASSDRAIALNPNAVEAWYNRGNALRLLRRLDEALVTYRRCLKLNPRFFEALINTGVIQQDQKQFREAVASYDAALAINPAATNAAYNRALALENIGEFDAAVLGYQDTLRTSPAYPYLIGRMHHARMQMCDWNDYLSGISSIACSVESGFPASIPFPFLAMTDSPELQRQCSQAFTADRFPSVENRIEFGARASDARIKVGYFSSDFRTHAVGFLTSGMFECHDRECFEIFAISIGAIPDGDAYNERIKSAVEHYVDASKMTDLEVVQWARSVGLDIAVDLTGHTMDARTGIFAQRVAPVQVNYLGYPGTMGASYMDVLLADDAVIPRGLDSFYSERIIRLPQTFQINDDRRVIGEVQSRGYYGLPEQGLVLASFNTSYKINPSIFDVWCRLLVATPDALLWLFGENDAQIANLRREAEVRGLSSERLVFAGHLPYAEHLARYAHVDLVLDTLPFNGGTSTSDALWGGAPVLTCTGQSFASRMSASLLNAVGLPELICNSIDDYEALALALAQYPDRLRQLKSYLQDHRHELPLFNTAGLTKDIENAYREILAS